MLKYINAGKGLFAFDAKEGHIIGFRGGKATPVAVGCISPRLPLCKNVDSSKGDRARQAHERWVLQQVLACWLWPASSVQLKISVFGLIEVKLELLAQEYSVR